MSTHVPGLQCFVFIGFLHHFVLVKLATTNNKVNHLHIGYACMHDLTSIFPPKCFFVIKV